jgi:3'5'-cyclic nucleotide phosphodiesterase
MQTYWCDPRSSLRSDCCTDEVSILSSEKITRLVDWNVEIFSAIIQKLATRRNKNGGEIVQKTVSVIEGEELRAPTGHSNMAFQENIELGSSVMDQIRNLVNAIASSYHGHPFHNFEHACHVTMAMTRLISSINPSTDNIASKSQASWELAMKQITSDPIIEFSCLFACLIHDVDHPGMFHETIFQNDDLIKLTCVTLLQVYQILSSS